MSLARKLISIAILTVFTAAAAHAQTTQPCTSYSDSSNPQMATCNGPSGASKVFGHDKTTIYAPEVIQSGESTSTYSGCFTDSNGKQACFKQCHTIQNGSPSDPSTIPDIFVPWRSPEEWSAFLAAAPPSPNAWLHLVVTSGCCIPVKLTKIGCYDSNGNLVSQVPLSTPISLGGRTIGTPLTSQNLPNSTAASQIYSDDSTQQGTAIFPDLGLSEWGAQQDVSGDAISTVDANGNQIDYEVTYTCDSGNAHYSDPSYIGKGYGGWIKMHDSGSCVPTDGACAAGSSTFPNNTPPSDLTSLCAQGSVFDSAIGLVTTANGWSWQCDGTGGSGCGTAGAPRQCQNTACTASSGPPIVGICGSANGTAPSSIPTNTGTTLCNTGTPSNVVDNTGTVGGTTAPWIWTCQGSSGAATPCATLTPAVCGSYQNAPSTAVNFATLLSEWNTDITAAGGNAYLITDPGFCKSGCLNNALSDATNYFTTHFNEKWTCASTCSGAGQVNCNVTNSKVDGSCGTAASSGITYASLSATTDIGILCHTVPSSPVFGANPQEPIDPAYIDSTGHIIAVGNQLEWKCEGLGGGAESPLCTTAYNPLATAGACGPLGSGGSFSTVPSGCAQGAPGGTGSGQCPLCAVGSTLDFPPTPGGAGWGWTCDGTNGGQGNFCWATNPNPIGQCGQDNGNNFPTLSSTDAGLCGGNTGYGTITNFVMDTTHYTYTWTCAGPGGMSPQCQAQIPGYCSSLANSTISTTTPAANTLCSPNSVPGAVTVQNDCCRKNPDGTPVQLVNWTCAGYGGGSTCTAQLGVTQGQAGTCGTGSAGACTVGTSSTPVCNGAGCTWTCSTSSGTSPQCTSSNSSLPTADGACGAANKQPTYITPNENLCNGGAPGSVTGTGPWSWTCFGTGNSTVNAQCGALVCSQCTGTYTRSNSTTRSGTINSCTITGTASWTETDNIVVPSGAMPGTLLSWLDDAGSFSYNVNSNSATSLSPSPGAPTYCGPCDLQLKHVSNAAVTINSVSGTCSHAKGDVLTPSNVSP